MPSDVMRSVQVELLAGAGRAGGLAGQLAAASNELSLLYRISGSMRVNQPPEMFLRSACNDLLEVMGLSAAAAVVLPHPPSASRGGVVLVGKCGLARRELSRLGQHLAQRLSPGQLGLIDNAFAGSGWTGRQGAVQNVIAAPLHGSEGLSGLLIGLNRDGGGFNPADLKLLIAIASQASMFLNNARLYADLEDLLMGVLHALTATIDAKDPYTCGHSQRVALLSKSLAQASGLDAQHVQQVYLAALLHDIGKIGVGEAILCKQGRLSDSELSIIRRHPVLGAEILGGIRQLDEVIDGVISHHERPDGLGYPRGLAGQDVPLEGRIVGLADSFDAMTSQRTYRAALSLEAAVTEIRANAGRQFDGQLVETLVGLDLAAFLDLCQQSAATVFPVRDQSQTAA